MKYAVLTDENGSILGIIPFIGKAPMLKQVKPVVESYYGETIHQSTTKGWKGTLELESRFEMMVGKHNKELFLTESTIHFDEDKEDRVHSFVDFANTDFTEAFLNKLEDLETYEDKILKEHIYSAERIKELTYMDADLRLTKDEQQTLDAITKECEKYDADYFRIIYS